MKKAYFILIVFLSFMTSTPALATNNVNQNNMNKNISSIARSKGVCRELMLNSLRRSGTNKKTIKSYHDKDSKKTILDFEDLSFPTK